MMLERVGIAGCHSKRNAQFTSGKERFQLEEGDKELFLGSVRLRRLKFRDVFLEKQKIKFSMLCKV
jgi:hypothetical protein